MKDAALTNATIFIIYLKRNRKNTAEIKTVVSEYLLKGGFI
jgi:hypothetical protein